MTCNEPILRNGETERTIVVEGNWDAIQLVLRRAKEQGLDTIVSAHISAMITVRKAK